MLSDQPARNSFCKELFTNFSVIASPGTGKTTAITERIANIICNCNNPNGLRSFLAVTYTEKAANEIKGRVFKNITSRIEQKLTPSSVLNNFNNVFFGTIHSLCAQFLRKHHAKIGIQEDFQIIENDAEYWEKFTTKYDFIDKISQREPLYPKILEFFQIDQILNAAHLAKEVKKIHHAPSVQPLNAISKFLEYPTSARETSIKVFQEDLSIWIQTNHSGPFPQFPKTNSQAFAKFLEENMPEFKPFMEDMQQYLINECYKQYQAYKIENDVLAYDDLITLTLNILSDKEYRAQHIGNYQIILDEAQDTDPNQFKILLNLTHRDCYGIVFENEAYKRDFAISFSMVGDPKQAIYSERADVKIYLFIHQKLEELGMLQSLNFNITMRCDKEIVSFANQKFSKFFLAQNFLFESMESRPDAVLGEVQIVQTTNNFTILEAVLKDIQGIKQYSDVAILAPRKSWLQEIASKFKQNPQLPSLQLWSNTSLENQPSLMKWTAALLHYIFNPADKRELAGILREVFGIRTDYIINYICHSECNICKKIDTQISEVRAQIDDLFIPNLIRTIIQNFQLLERINSLNIYPTEEIVAHYNLIMDIVYKTDIENSGYETLEKDLISAYRQPPSEMKLNKNSVQLLTYHKSKGLEWPIVILPFMYREHKIVSTCSDQQENINNEFRMLFVACTRAKHKLILLDDSQTAQTSSKSNMISSGKLLNNFS